VHWIRVQILLFQKKNILSIELEWIYYSSIIDMRLQYSQNKTT
jgi:hypothetical protein